MDRNKEAVCNLAIAQLTLNRKADVELETDDYEEIIREVYKESSDLRFLKQWDAVKEHCVISEDKKNKTVKRFAETLEELYHYTSGEGRLLYKKWKEEFKK